MSYLFDGYREPLRVRLSYRVRDLADYIWTKGGLDEVRLTTSTDLVLIQVVGRLGRLADRLDPPW